MGTETGVQHNLKEAEKAIEKLIGLMRVMMGHDDSDKDVVEFFPKYANSWKALNWWWSSRWRFLKNFKGAVRERLTKT